VVGWVFVCVCVGGGVLNRVVLGVQLGLIVFFVITIYLAK
jgi:hypothetical protein